MADFSRFVKLKAYMFHNSVPYIEIEDFEQEGQIAAWENDGKDNTIVFMSIESAMKRLVDKETKQRGPFYPEYYFSLFVYDDISELTKLQREVMKMYYNEKIKDKDIAEKLNVSQVAVNRIRGRAKRKISRLFVI